MSRTVEIQPAPNDLAYVETYVNGRLTHRTEAMPLPAARIRAEVLGCNVVDHTKREAAA